MIPFQELDKALARWKSRSQGAEAAPELIEAGQGSVPQGVDGLPPPTEATGEIDLNDDVVESYDER